MKIQSYFAGAALAAFAASAPALAQDQKAAAPAADVVHEWLIVRNTTYIPVIDTVTRKLAEARKAFVAKDPKAAAAGVREVAKLLAGQGAKATAPERKRLAGAAAELDRLAAGLDTAKVKTTRQFDAAYSKALRADVVLRQTAGDTGTWIRLSGEPDRHFGAAAEAFGKKEYRRAAEEIRKGEAMVELESGQAAKGGQAGLKIATANLEKLATAVDRGTVKSGKTLETAFARADHALALAHRANAAESWSRKETKRAGAELNAAAQSLEQAGAWAGGEVRAGASGSASAVRTLGDKLTSGATATRDEVAEGFKSLGNAIDAVGKKIGGSGKASPFHAGA